MLDVLEVSSGVRLALNDYLADYRRRFAVSDGHDSWKLERRQHFSERVNTSWRAFVSGNWDEALRLIRIQTEDVQQEMKEPAERGIGLFRVRVVEWPIIPYVQWELNSLRVRAECGEKIHVVDPRQVKCLETDGPLPELLTVGNDTVYQLLYDDDDLIKGAIRFTDADVLIRCVTVMKQLYTTGEDVRSFFERQVAHLPPPRQG
jgi:hypothetical protein